MDDPSSDTDHKESELEINEENENDWHISIEQEQKYIINEALDKFFYIPDSCPLCGREINMQMNNNILKPILFRCNFINVEKQLILEIIVFLNCIELFL